eukprot:SAG11_NODE_3823_length_2206_cov_5.701946_1_plen_156_part_10
MKPGSVAAVAKHHTYCQWRTTGNRGAGAGMRTISRRLLRCCATILTCGALCQTIMVPSPLCHTQRVSVVPALQVAGVRLKDDWTDAMLTQSTWHGGKTVGTPRYRRQCLDLEKGLVWGAVSTKSHTPPPPPPPPLPPPSPPPPAWWVGFFFFSFSP